MHQPIANYAPVHAYAPGHGAGYMTHQPAPLQSQPVPMYKLRHFIAPNVLPIEYHFPFKYSICPQKWGKTWFIPYMADESDPKDLYKSQDDLGPPMPCAVAMRVRWMTCEQR